MRAGRILVAGVGVLAVAVGALWFLSPVNETPEEGPADPILGVRRWAIGVLRDAGLIAERGFGGDCYLPSVYATEAGPGSPDGRWEPGQRMEIEREPVYRGPFGPVGDRITYRTMLLDGTRSTRSALRLCYAEDGVRHLAGEATPGRGLDPSGARAEVRGYVPRSATAYWAEEVDAAGEVHSLDGWGDTSRWWRD